MGHFCNILQRPVLRVSTFACRSSAYGHSLIKTSLCSTAGEGEKKSIYISQDNLNGALLGLNSSVYLSKERFKQLW